MLYLHGFASGPTSSKAQSFRRFFAARGVDVDVPTLDEGDFEYLTISRLREVVRRCLAASPRPHVVVGSSLGGYLAALHASEHEVDALVLMAPAFDFAARLIERHGAEALARWEREGSTQIDHFALRRPIALRFEFARDASKHSAFPRILAPALVFHGRRDDVVPLERVERWVAENPSARLVVLDDGHEVVQSIDRILDETRTFLGALRVLPTPA